MDETERLILARCSRTDSRRPHPVSGRCAGLNTPMTLISATLPVYVGTNGED